MAQRLVALYQDLTPPGADLLGELPHKIAATHGI
jgi:hypothetical protein